MSDDTVGAIRSVRMTCVVAAKNVGELIECLWIAQEQFDAAVSAWLNMGGAGF